MTPTEQFVRDVLPEEKRLTFEIQDRIAALGPTVGTYISEVYRFDQWDDLDEGVLEALRSALESAEVFFRVERGRLRKLRDGL